jgi:hypothetical protein
VQHDIHVLPRVAVRHDVVAVLVIDRVDAAGRHELVDRHRGAAVDARPLEILIVEQDVMILLELVALHQIAA